MRNTGSSPAAVALVCGCLLAGCGAPAPPATPTPEDLAILDRATLLLDEGSAWENSGDRECDPADTRYNVFCALWSASRDILGTYDHRRFALEEVREAIEVVSGRDWPHRLQDFNNDPATGWTDIANVLQQARSAVEEGLSAVRTEADVHMTRYALVLLRAAAAENVDPDAVADARRGHFEAIGRLEAEGRLVVAGPVEWPEGITVGDVEGVYLFRDTSSEPVEALLEQDPAIRSGLLRPEVLDVWLPAGLSWPNPKYAVGGG